MTTKFKFRLEFGNPKHIEAMSEIKKLDELNKKFETANVSTETLQKIRLEIERQHRVINSLLSK